MTDRYEHLRMAQMPETPPVQERVVVNVIESFDALPAALTADYRDTTNAATQGIIEVDVVDSGHKISHIDALKARWDNRNRRVRIRRETESGSRVSRKIAAFALGLTLAATGTVAYAQSQESEPETTVPEYEAEPFTFSQEDVCPDGIFPNGKYEANRNAFADELNVRPENELNNKGEFMNYLFAASPGPGVACQSAATEAVMIAGVNDLLGAGRIAGQGFSTTNIAELQRRLAYNTERAEENVHILASLYAQGGMNAEPFEGAYYRAAQHEGVGGKPRVVFIQEHLDVNEAGQVYVLSLDGIGGDTFGEGDSDQVIVIDRDGNIYFRKAIGARVVETSDSAEDGASEAGPSNGGGGGSGNGAGEGPGHDGDRRGCDGTCGQGSHGGGGHGGGCGGSCGGGCGGCGGGHGGGTTTTTDRPSTTTTTDRPSTTTTTRPPVTTTTTRPPVTTTTTRPPVTTTTTPPTTPPPTHPPSDGPPGGATQ